MDIIKLFTECIRKYHGICISCQHETLVTKLCENMITNSMDTNHQTITFCHSVPMNSVPIGTQKTNC